MAPSAILPVSLLGAPPSAVPSPPRLPWAEGSCIISPAAMAWAQCSRRHSRIRHLERLVLATLCLVTSASEVTEVQEAGSVALRRTSWHMRCVHGDRALTSHRSRRDTRRMTRSSPARCCGTASAGTTQEREKKEKEEPRMSGEKAARLALKCQQGMWLFENVVLRDE